MKYYIPIIGYAIAVYEYEKAYRDWQNGGPSEPTWPAFANTNKAFGPTVAFLVLGIIVCKIFFHR